MKKLVISTLLCGTLTLSVPARAFWDPTGPAQVMYLTKILLENYKRFKQLQGMIRDAKDHRQYVRWINEGLNNATGLLRILPIEDERILGELQNFQQAVQAINELYGIIPDSKEALMHRLHDQAIAESLKVINKSRTYATKQEENAIRVFHEGSNASPKGAARMTAQTSAQILHTLNQILKVNGQLLKITSANLAYQNKVGKQSVNNYQKLGHDIKDSFAHFEGEFTMPRF